jgi:uncharacterized protein involved in type VI secretion and phage assembly
VSAVATVVEPVVHVQGLPLAPEHLRTLAGVTVRQHLSQPTLCELTFVDPARDLEGSALVRPGTSLRVGLPGHDETLFDGETTAVELTCLPSRAHEIRVRGYDRLHRLRKRGPVRSHVQVTPRDLARELVSDLGLSVQAAEAGPMRRIVIQQNQSDFDLLEDASGSCGLYLALRGTTLHLVTLDGTGTPVPLELGSSLLEARFELNADPACRSVSVTGWNPLRVEHHEGRAASARVGRATAAEAPPGRFGTRGDLTLAGEAGPDSRHAQALAQAELDRRIAAEVIFTGTAQGDPALRPGARVSVKGAGEAFSGRYVLTAVTHIVDNRVGFVSELSTAPPRPRRRSRHAVATKGLVTRVNDPDHLGRIRVSLPAYGNVETEWMGTLSPGAGPGKGLVASPDVGDQVLVLFVHDDPAQGVVLGGLYGAQGPFDAGVEGEAIGRYTLRTGKGQKVVLDDIGRVIRLENSNGSYVELAPAKVRLHAATDLEIDAPGQAVTIRARTIDFERG